MPYFSGLSCSGARYGMETISAEELLLLFVSEILLIPKSVILAIGPVVRQFDNDICRFNIAVNNSFFMEIGETMQNIKD